MASYGREELKSDLSVMRQAVLASVLQRGTPLPDLTMLNDMLAKGCSDAEILSKLRAAPKMPDVTPELSPPAAGIMDSNAEKVGFFRILRQRLAILRTRLFQG